MSYLHAGLYANIVAQVCNIERFITSFSMIPHPLLHFLWCLSYLPCCPVSKHTLQAALSTSSNMSIHIIVCICACVCAVAFSNQYETAFHLRNVWLMSIFVLSISYCCASIFCCDPCVKCDFLKCVETQHWLRKTMHRFISYQLQTFPTLFNSLKLSKICIFDENIRTVL